MLGGEIIEKNNTKVLVIIALIITVLALSAGFAAFTTSLNITNASASITVQDTFASNVNYKSNSAHCYVTGNSEETIQGANAGTTSAKTWSDISVPLTAEIPSVTCEATVENASTFIAYLQSITASGALLCDSATTGTGAVSSNKLTPVCSAATMELTIDNASYLSATDKLQVTTSSQGTPTTNGQTSIAAKTTNNGDQIVDVTVYTSSSAISALDGDVIINLPTITLDYTTAPTGN